MWRPPKGRLICWASSVGTWPLWRLQPRLRCYVLSVCGAGAVAIATAAAYTTWRARDVAIYGLLLVLGAATVEAVAQWGEPAGSISKDAHGVWQLAAAVLLPPVYVLIAPAVILALTHWRIRRSLAYRRVFSATAIGLSYGAASLAFHAGWRHGGRLPTDTAEAASWLLLAVACAVLRWGLNNALVATAVRLDDPAARLKDHLGTADALYNDAAELCLGTLVAFAATVAPIMVILALPCGTLLQRSSSHAQLLHASRTDAKTGLLTATAWQREANAQVIRAIRTRTPAAVAMVDIDHFKQVNDVFGHLAGDAVLASVAAALSGSMREYDLAGRFGGEEFSVFLPQTGADAALLFAERLRRILGQILIPVATPAGNDEPHITVSIGVAILGPGIGDLTDLLADADAALYRAKREGRNAVRLAEMPMSSGDPKHFQQEPNG